MNTKSDSKKTFEAILDGKLGDNALQIMQLPVALSTKTESVTTYKHPFVGVTPNVCSQNNSLDVSGFAITGSNGQSEFRLSNFICPLGEVYEFPINVIATPLSSKPSFLTVTHTLVNNKADVRITVFAWDASGAAAANVHFNWRCRVQLPLFLQSAIHQLSSLSESTSQ